MSKLCGLFLVVDVHVAEWRFISKKGGFCKPPFEKFDFVYTAGGIGGMPSSGFFSSGVSCNDSIFSPGCGASGMEGAAGSAGAAIGSDATVMLSSFGSAAAGSENDATGEGISGAGGSAAGVAGAWESSAGEARISGLTGAAGEETAGA